jgi:hypothetical protein
VHLDLIDQHTAAIGELTRRIEQVIEPFRGFRDLICSIPGIAHSLISVNDRAPASIAATAASNNDASVCRTPRGSRGSGTCARYPARTVRSAAGRF